MRAFPSSAGESKNTWIEGARLGVIVASVIASGWTVFPRNVACVSICGVALPGVPRCN